MCIWNHAYALIDFDFVELSFASVLRLPRPHLASLKLRESEEGSEEPNQVFLVELGAAKINLLPPRPREAATAEQGWGWGK
jgi:hypothetical protein